MQSTELPPETIRRWQAIVDLLAETISVPLALVTRIDRPDLFCVVSNGQNYQGVSPGRRWVMEKETFCRFTLAKRDGHFVTDARKDEKYRGIAALELDLNSYIGYPIERGDGTVFGTLCVLDRATTEHKSDHKLLIELLRDLLETDLRTIWTFEKGLEIERNRRIEIEAEVSRRTEELVAAVQRAEKADRVRSQFLGSVTHELRTPLNAIIGTAELLQHQNFGPYVAAPYKESAGDILKAAKQLLNLIEDCLELVRVTSETKDAEIEEVDVRYLINHVIRRVTPIASAAGVRVESDVPADADTILSNERDLAKILGAIMANAVKFSQRGDAAKLNVRMNDGHIEFGVHDSGSAITDWEVPSLIIPFSEIDEGQVGRKAGRGIAMSLASVLAKRLAGSLSIESCGGGGTTVSVKLPLLPSTETIE